MKLIDIEALNDALESAVCEMGIYKRKGLYEAKEIANNQPSIEADGSEQYLLGCSDTFEWMMDAFKKYVDYWNANKNRRGKVDKMFRDSMEYKLMSEYMQRKEDLIVKGKKMSNTQHR